LAVKAIAALPVSWWVIDGERSLTTMACSVFDLLRYERRYNVRGAAALRFE
jgi:hypothetical protein